MTKKKVASSKVDPEKKKYQKKLLAMKKANALAKEEFQKSYNERFGGNK